MGLFDEGDVLVDELQDRDAREVDLLLARQPQQHVERPLVAVEVDDEPAVIGVPAGARLAVVGLERFCRQSTLLPVPRDDGDEFEDRLDRRSDQPEQHVRIDAQLPADQG